MSWKARLATRVRAELLRVSDGIEQFCGVRGTLTPPQRLAYGYGGGPFNEIGLEFFRHLLDHANLQRDSAVLDVGCGIGRMAIPLTAYLKAPGFYRGFDIIALGTDYCTTHITPSQPLFRFEHADIHNSFYNPAGRIAPEDFWFPYPDATFDVVFSTSVFTHLKPAAVSNYLQETARVLKPGGHCLHTCFALDEIAQRQVDAGLDSQQLRYRFDGFLSNDRDYIESAIGMPWAQFQDDCTRSGLLQATLHPGSWSGRPGPCVTYQDILTARRA